MIREVVLVLLGLALNPVLGAVQQPMDEFAGNTTQTIMAQKPTILDLQSQIDSTDQSRLGPAVAKNTNILKSLRQASLMLDGKSDLDLNITSLRNNLNSTRIDINGTKIPTIKTGLEDVRTALTSQASQVRALAQQTTATRWTALDAAAFAGFLTQLRNQTINVIKNVSQPINEIENFDNQTTPGLSRSVSQAERTLNESLSNFYRSLQLGSNSVQYVQDAILKLLNDQIPKWENQTVTEVYAEIENSVKELAAQSGSGTDDIQRNLDAQINATINQLYRSLNNTRDGILTQLKDPSEYEASITALQDMADQYSDLSSHTATMRSMVQDKMGALTSRKGFLLKNILPLVNGLGNKTRDLQARYELLLTDVQKQLNTSRDAQFGKLDSEAASLKTKFISSVNASYYNNIAPVQSKLNDVPGFVKTRLQLANNTLEDLLQRAGPRIADMKNSMANVAVQVGEIKKQVMAAIGGVKNSAFGKMDSQFADLQFATGNELDDLEGKINGSYKATVKSMTDFRANIDGQETNMTGSVSKALDDLASNRARLYGSFNSSLKTVPDITTDQNAISSETARNNSLTAVEADISQLESQVSGFQKSWSTSIGSVNTALARLDLGAFTKSVKDQLRSMIDKKMADAYANITLLLPQYVNNSDSLNAQVAQLIQTVRTIVQGFIDSQANYTQWAPAVDIGQIETAVRSLLDSAKQSRFQVGSAADSISSDFSRNVSSDDQNVDAQLAQMLASQVASSLGNLTSQLDPNNSVAMMTNVLNDVQSKLSDYSDDGSAYRSKVQQAKDAFEAMEQSLTNGKNALELTYPDLSRTANQGMSDVQLELAKLVATAPAVIGDGSRITRFGNDTNLLIDQTVNSTRDKIFLNLKSQFIATQDAIQAYMDSVNSSIGTIVASAGTALTQLSSSAMQLKKTNARTKQTFRDGLEAAKTEKLKNIRLHALLGKHADEIETALDSLEKAARTAETDFKTQASGIETELNNNVQEASAWVLNRTSMAEKSMEEDSASANATIAHRQRAGELNIVAARKKARADLRGTLNELDKTDVFKALEDVGHARKALSHNTNVSHSVAADIVAAMNSTNLGINSGSGEYKTLVMRLGEMVKEISKEFPAAMSSENEAVALGIRDEGRKIADMVDEHQFNYLDFKKGLDKFYIVPIIGDMLGEARQNVKHESSKIRPIRDFQTEIDDIRNQLRDIQEKHKSFLRKQVERIRGSLSRSQHRRGKQ